MRKTEVISVRRKYIGTAENRKYILNFNSELYYLKENVKYGDVTFLFLSEETAISHIRTMHLRSWLTRLNYINCKSFTLEQLEQVYKILEGGI